MANQPWRVLIVEDDPTVSYIHRHLIQRSGRFEVVEIVASGEAALLAAQRSSPHLVILDLTLDGMDGVRALRALRAKGSEVEVIAVTASAAPQVVRTVVHLGVVDYLVKPFQPERLEKALGLFLRRMATLRSGTFGQPEIDALTAAGRSSPRWLPKGLSEASLKQVREILVQAERDGEWLSADAVAARVATSRVTARRYLEYLVATGQADLELHSDGPGRPRKLYHHRGQVKGSSGSATHRLPAA